MRNKEYSTRDIDRILLASRINPLISSYYIDFDILEDNFHDNAVARQSIAVYVKDRSKDTLSYDEWQEETGEKSTEKYKTYILKEYEELLDKIEPEIQEIIDAMQTYKLGMTITASGFIILAVMESPEYQNRDIITRHKNGEKNRINSLLSRLANKYLFFKKKTPKAV